MARARTLAGVLGVALATAGCSFASDALWPSLSGGSPSGTSTATSPRTSSGAGPAGQRTEIAPSAAERSGSVTNSAEAPPALGSTDFQPPAVTPGASTGTFVGQKVTELRGELGRLQADIRGENARLQDIRGGTAANARDYHNTIGSIQARLQVGTTPGNPILVRQWNEAQSNLDRISTDVASMNTLATEVAGSSAFASYLLESVRAAYGLSGAVEEDHRQLAILEDEVNRTVVTIDRLLNELSDDVARQSAYLSGERRNLTALALAIKNGQLYGGSLANRAYSTAAPAASVAAVNPPAGPIASRRPLVVIRFDRSNVQYEQALYNAVSQALERRPAATFDLVAVAPGRGDLATVTRASNAAKRSAETVLRSLSDMGLPLDRVRLSAMTSEAAQANEVHLYVR